MTLERINAAIENAKNFWNRNHDEIARANDLERIDDMIDELEAITGKRYVITDNGLVEC